MENVDECNFYVIQLTLQHVLQREVHCSVAIQIYHKAASIHHYSLCRILPIISIRF